MERNTLPEARPRRHTASGSKTSNALHPALACWFASRFTGRSEIQRKALPHTLAGRNTLILAPTGSGKTLAAFLSVLSGLGKLAEAKLLPNRVCAVYVSPLKALSRDIHRNLSEPLAALNAQFPPASQIRMEVRTGDTSQKERGKQKRKRPHLLLTTAESLSTLLSQRGWSEDGFDVRVVVVDEIHAFAGNKRGSLLALALERLEAQSKQAPQRIGLSATAFPLDTVAALLCGARRCEIAQVSVTKTHELTIAEIPGDLWLPPAGHNPYRVAAVVADLVQKARSTLVFTDTRSAAERLGLALPILLPDQEARIAVHHGSVDRAERQSIEEGLAQGKYLAVVCSSSLELGVDYQTVDQVLLIGPPRGVSRALQRLGRSGHRIDGVARGIVVPLSLPDLLQCVALRQAAHDGELDRLHPPRAPLDVLAQTLLAMSIERPWHPDEALALVRRAGPYLDLARSDFDVMLEYLAGGGKVKTPDAAYGKILFDDEGRFRVASQKVARQFYMNAGVISDDFHVRVVTRRNRRLGEVEEEFLSGLQPDEAFLISGKVVRVVRMHADLAIVEPAQSDRVQTPRWFGGKMSLSAELAGQERKLREQLRSTYERGGGRACVELLTKGWHTARPAAQRIAEYVERQTKAAPIPVSEPMLVERVIARQTLLLIFHVVAGRAVNRSLAWVLARRLGKGASVAANYDDHSFLLTLDERDAPDEHALREAFRPEGWLDDLNLAIAGTERLGPRFRRVAETGQLLARKVMDRGLVRRPSRWSASVLYATLKEHEPEHPLVRETIREMLEDECDAAAAHQEAARIFAIEWDVRDLARPSPFGLPVFAAFNRETLLAGDADRALEDLVTSLYAEWEQTV